MDVLGSHRRSLLAVKKKTITKLLAGSLTYHKAASTIMAHLRLTFAIIKPHAIQNPVALHCIYNIIAEHGFDIVKTKTLLMDNSMAERFYQEHRAKFFYNRLATFMCSGPLHAVILLHKDNAISRWRDLMGPTKVFKAIYTHPDSIRGQFGLTDTRNACHGSDSPESVQREVRIIYPELNLDQLYREM